MCMVFWCNVRNICLVPIVMVSAACIAGMLIFIVQLCDLQWAPYLPWCLGHFAATAGLDLYSVFHVHFLFFMWCVVSFPWMHWLCLLSFARLFLPLWLGLDIPDDSFSLLEILCTCPVPYPLRGVWFALVVLWLSLGLWISYCQAVCTFSFCWFHLSFCLVGPLFWQLSLSLMYCSTGWYLLTSLVFMVSAGILPFVGVPSFPYWVSTSFFSSVFRFRAFCRLSTSLLWWHKCCKASMHNH